MGAEVVEIHLAPPDSEGAQQSVQATALPRLRLRPWAAGEPAWPGAQPVPRSLSLRGDPRRLCGAGAAGAPRLGGRGPGAGRDAEVASGRAGGPARLQDSAARPHRLAGAPGAATRARGRQVSPGGRALLSAPAGHLPAAGWGLARCGRAGGVSVRLFQVPELRVGNAQGRTRPAVVGVPKMPPMS